jgi:hypothetical protein
MPVKPARREVLGKHPFLVRMWLQIPNRADQGMDTRNGARSKLSVLRIPQPSTVRSRRGKW